VLAIEGENQGGGAVAGINKSIIQKRFAVLNLYWYCSKEDERQLPVIRPHVSQ
jgi:hypothetical protein